MTEPSPESVIALARERSNGGRVFLQSEYDTTRGVSHRVLAWRTPIGTLCLDESAPTLSALAEKITAAGAAKEKAVEIFGRLCYLIRDGEKE